MLGIHQQRLFTEMVQHFFCLRLRGIPRSGPPSSMVKGRTGRSATPLGLLFCSTAPAGSYSKVSDGGAPWVNQLIRSSRLLYASFVVRCPIDSFLSVLFSSPRAPVFPPGNRFHNLILYCIIFLARIQHFFENFTEKNLQDGKEVYIMNVIFPES